MCGSQRRKDSSLYRAALPDGTYITSASAAWLALIQTSKGAHVWYEDVEISTFPVA
jgi:hypothetical protein